MVTSPVLRVEVYEDPETGLFHYQAREMGVKSQNKNPTLCGMSVLDMRPAAWFDVGDRRGKVHFERGCEECRKGLVF